MSPARGVGWAVVVLGAGGCGFHETALDWTDQLEPGGPCYAVDLSDGLGGQDNAEAHALFACLDRRGALASLAALDAALDAPTRDGSVGQVLADAGSGVDLASVSVADAVDTARGWLDDREPLARARRLLLELVYARPFDDAGQAFAFGDPAALADGVLVPALDAAAGTAGSVLDNPGAAAAAASLARAPEARDAAWTLAALGLAHHAQAQQLAETWPAHVGDALARTADATNNRDLGASGDSARDLVGAALADGGAQELAEIAAPILADGEARDAVEDELRAAQARGHLDTLGPEAARLVEIDAGGGALEPGEASALVALVRLFARANQECVCSVDLGVTSFEVSLGNLAVAILESLAAQDPADAESSVEILADALGLGLVEGTLDAVAQSGACPPIDAMLVSDLEAIDRLTDPTSADLLDVLLGLLRALHDHIPAVADLATALHARGLDTRIDELVRDVGNIPLAADGLVLLAMLLDPAPYYVGVDFPAGVEPLDFAGAWALAAAAAEPATVQATAPVLAAAVGTEGTWRAAHAMGRVLAEAGTEMGSALTVYAEAMAADPSADPTGALADTLDDPAATRWALLLAECPQLRAALQAAEASPGVDGPLPFLARIARGDTLDVVLDTLDLLDALATEEDS